MGLVLKELQSTLQLVDIKNYMRKKSFQKKKIINSKKDVFNGLILMSLGIAIVLVGFQIFDIFKRKYEIELEKQALMRQVERIKQDTVSLEQVKDYISSNEYQEREAKQKLDLKKPGEEVVLITPGSITANLSNDELISILRDPNAQSRLPAQSNLERWWAFFFDKERL